MAGSEEGWGFPDGANVAHYFRETLSPCRRYGFYRGGLFSDDMKGGIACCKACQKKLERETAKENSDG